jgi:hypothetical protein
MLCVYETILALGSAKANLAVPPALLPRRIIADQGQSFKANVATG